MVQYNQSSSKQIPPHSQQRSKQYKLHSRWPHELIWTEVDRQEPTWGDWKITPPQKELNILVHHTVEMSW